MDQQMKAIMMNCFHETFLSGELEIDRVFFGASWKQLDRISLEGFTTYPLRCLVEFQYYGNPFKLNKQVTFALHCIALRCVVLRSIVLYYVLLSYYIRKYTAKQ